MGTVKTNLTVQSRVRGKWASWCVFFAAHLARLHLAVQILVKIPGSARDRHRQWGPGPSARAALARAEGRQMRTCDRPAAASLVSSHEGKDQETLPSTRIILCKRACTAAAVVVRTDGTRRQSHPPRHIGHLHVWARKHTYVAVCQLCCVCRHEHTSPAPRACGRP